MNSKTPPLLSAHNLCLQAKAAILLDNVSLQLAAGEVLGVIGPNGAGKSSLLKLLAGIGSPGGGFIRLGERPLAECSAAYKATTVAYLEQRPHVHWPLTVRQVVSLGRLPHATASVGDAETAVQAALAFTGISALHERIFNTLSEGEKMLVNISRVLATQPRIVLADEPTAALDVYHQLLVLELLRTLAAEGRGIMLVLHDLNLAARFCDRLLLLAQGRVVCDGSPQEVLSARNIAEAYHIDAVYDPGAKTVRTIGRL
jgi:ABC-type cobalamin/Fe3+-siderophores transport system ATPase subunit